MGVAATWEMVRPLEYGTVETLVREHSAFVARLARQLLVDADAAEDVSQQTWQVVLQRGVRGIADVRAWLTGVVRNLARLHRRGEAARRRREWMAARQEAQWVGDPAARMEQMERLVAALRRLPEPYASVVWLRFFEELPPRVIAQRRRESVETIKSRLRRGLALLRADLRRQHGGEERAWRGGLLLLVPRLRTTAVGGASLAVAAASLVLLAATWIWSGAREGAVEEEPARVEAVAATAATGSTDEGHGVVRVPAEMDAAGGAGVAPRRQIQLVDARTGEPLAEFVVAVPDADPALQVTDAGGWLELGRRSDGQASEVRLIDDLRLRAERPIEAVLEGAQLRTRVGPTYRLVLHPGPQTGDRFDARLVAAEPGAQLRTCFAPVRLGETPWVRFGAEAGELQGGPPWCLEIRSDDGYRFGSAEVGRIVGQQQEPVIVALRATGRLVGRVHQPDGAPVDQAALRLVCGEQVFGGASDVEGAFDLPWLPPGTYDLHCSSRLHEPATARIVIAAGQLAEQRLALTPLPAAGVVAGRLLGESSDAPPAGQVAVVLASRDDPDQTYLQMVSCAAAAPDGELGRFRFERIPPGRYELTVRGSDFTRWRPASVPAVPGAQDLELRRADSEPCSDLELCAVDARSGAPIAQFDLFVQLDGQRAMAKVLPAQAGRILLRRVPLSARVAWTLRAPGHVPVSGDRNAAAVPILVEPGWGNELHCVDRDGRPLAGVAVLLDGDPAGVTGADGRLQLRRDAAPARIALHAEDRVLVAGDVLADGTFRDLIWGIGVTLAAPPARRSIAPTKADK